MSAGDVWGNRETGSKIHDERRKDSLTDRSATKDEGSGP